MTIKRVKDYTHLYKSATMYSTLPCQGKYYIDMYLWGNRDALEANAAHCDKDTKAAFCSMPYRVRINEDGSEDLKVKPKLGELHFVKDDWNMEIVAHELQHALAHRMRVLEPFAQQVMDQDDSHDYIKSAEERFCREAGRWFDELYRWLWRHNAYGKHAQGHDKETLGAGKITLPTQEVQHAGKNVAQKRQVVR